MSIHTTFICDGCGVGYIDIEKKVPAERVDDAGTAVLVEGFIYIPEGWEPMCDRYLGDFTGEDFVVLCPECLL